MRADCRHHMHLTGALDMSGRIERIRRLIEDGSMDRRTYLGMLVLFAISAFAGGVLLMTISWLVGEHWSALPVNTVSLLAVIGLLFAFKTSIMGKRLRNAQVPSAALIPYWVLMAFSIGVRVDTTGIHVVVEEMAPWLIVGSEGFLLLYRRRRILDPRDSYYSR